MEISFIPCKMFGRKGKGISFINKSGWENIQINAFFPLGDKKEYKMYKFQK